MSTIDTARTRAQDAEQPAFVPRMFRGHEDYPGLVVTLNAARRAAGMVETFSVEGLAAEFDHATN